MKISIITWDASFREYFHTVRCFLDQQFDNAEYEFIWVDFYENQNRELIELLNENDHFHLLNLGNTPQTQWHLGKCINAGVAASTGDILILPDGDILSDLDLLSTIEAALSGDEPKVVYCRRWDELEKNHHPEKSYTIDYLEEVCQLNNPTNYAGLVAMKRRTFEQVGGYEEHAIFSGPGANGLEQYLRFRNAGCYIQWNPKKIYHPHHSFTGSSDKFLDELIQLKSRYNWLNPYSGIQQSWFLKESERSLRTMANSDATRILESTPSLDSLRRGNSRKKKTWLQKLFR